MTYLKDTDGRSLPAIECPDAERLRAYGDLAFLAFRSPRHARMPVSLLRTYLEPPLATGQFRIFRFDGVPRGAFTWAMLGPEAERKLVTGHPLAPEDWTSGDRLWIIDLIAPYRGLTQGIVRWIMVPGNVTDRAFSFRRVAEDDRTRRIVRIDFQRDRLSEVLSEEDFLAGNTQNADRPGRGDTHASVRPA